MIIKVKSDLQKAQALVEMARISFQRLNETDLYKYPTNTLVDYYEIIHKLMEAITSKEGVKVKGEGAHQELINYISKKYNLKEVDRQFIQEIREFRNRISYEGFSINKEYIKINVSRINNIIDSLREIFNKYL